MVRSEGCCKLGPGDLISGGLHGQKCCPPRGGGASQLMSREEGLLGLCTSDQLKLGFHQANPAVGHKRIFSLGKSGWMGSRKITVGSGLGLPMPSLRLLLMNLVLSQHLQNLSLLSYHFGQCLGRWWRVMLSTVLGTLSGSPGVHHSAI